MFLLPCSSSSGRCKGVYLASDDDSYRNLDSDYHKNVLKSDYIDMVSGSGDVVLEIVDEVILNLWIFRKRGGCQAH